MRNESQDHWETYLPTNYNWTYRAICLTPNCSKLGFASNCIKALLICYLCIFNGKKQPDFSSVLLCIPISHSLAMVSQEVRVLPDRGDTFHQVIQLFANLTKITSQECPSAYWDQQLHGLREEDHGWTKGAGTLAQAVRQRKQGGTNRQGWSAVCLRKFHLLGEVGGNQWYSKSGMWQHWWWS